MKFRHDKFREWEDSSHIPAKVMDMVNFIAEKIGHGGWIEEETIKIYNRGGYVIGYAKGFRIVHCTFSNADGPSADYSKEFSKWLKGLDFEIENSYGDNGMDCSTNWHDTYWTHEFIYKPSVVEEEEFIQWEEKDYVY